MRYWVFVSMDRVWLDASTDDIAVLTKEISVYRKSKWARLVKRIVMVSLSGTSFQQS